MRIGILTFHWAANHGAVLQTYALQKYLVEKYHATVDVINYYPKNLEINIKNTLKNIRPKNVFYKIKELKKEHYIRSFRKELNTTQRIFHNKDLSSFCKKYDVLVSGSDQVWNPSFLLGGENDITPTYFFGFDNNCKKISVSASFGCINYPVKGREIVVPLLKKFDFISVREKTGINILKEFGINNAYFTADPTALLNKNFYNTLCGENFNIDVAYCILRGKNNFSTSVIDFFCSQLNAKKAINIECSSVYNWLSAIKCSKIVVTNSFHCVMMCLKLHTNFVVLLENGKLEGMNDRFLSLLTEIDLQSRIVSDLADLQKIDCSIDFQDVDAKMERYAKTLVDFLDLSLG